MGKGEEGADGRSVLVAEAASSPAGIRLVTDVDEIRTQWATYARPDLWSDDFDILTYIAPSGSVPLLLHDEQEDVALLLSPLPGKNWYSNYGASWGENVRLPKRSKGWWREVTRVLRRFRPELVGLALGFTTELAPLEIHRSLDAVRYTLPHYPSVAAYLEARLSGERKRRLRKASPLALERADHKTVFPFLAQFQEQRHEVANFSKPELVERFGNVCTYLEGRGLDRHYLARDEQGTVVGAALGFNYSKDFIYWQDGHDTSIPGLGNRLNLAVLEQAFSEGKGIDWMSGKDQPFKRDFWRFDAEPQQSPLYILRVKD